MQRNMLSLAGLALLLVILPSCRDSKDEYRSKKEYTAGKKHHKKEQSVKKYKNDEGKHRTKKVTIEEESDM